MKKEYRGYVYSITSAFLFGTAGMFVKLTQSTGLNSSDILTVQYTLAVIILFSISYIKYKDKILVSKEKLIRLMILGVLGNVSMTICYYKAFEYLPVAMVTMLLYTYPIMVFIYTSIYRRKRIDISKIVAVFIAFIGCIFTLNIISGQFKYSYIGIVFGLLSAVFYSFMNIYTEEKLSSEEPLIINAYSTLFSLIVLYVYRFPIYVFKGELSFKSIYLIGILAIVCQIIPLTFLYSAIRYIGALKVSIINNLEIPTAMFLSFIILGEKVTVFQMIGAVLIVYAIYLISCKKVKKNEVL